MNPNISIVLACYNEEKLFDASVRRIMDVMDRSVWEGQYELVFVDDCSKDNTREKILALEASAPDIVRHIFHTKNTGKGGALVDGLNAAKGGIIGFFDIDLEVDARFVYKFIKAIEEGYDVAAGMRHFKDEKITPYIIARSILGEGFRFLVRNYIGLPYRDTQCGFKFFNRQTALPTINRTQGRAWVWDVEVMALVKKDGLKVKEIPCTFIRRTDKTSSLKLKTDVSRMWSGLRELKRRGI